MPPTAGGAKAYAIGAVRVRHRVLLPPLAIQRDRNVAARGWTLVGAPGASTAAPAAFPGFAARAQTAARRARGGASGDALDLLSLADALGALPVKDRVWTDELRGTVVDLAASGAAYAACAQRGPCGRQAVLASANTVRSDVAQVPQILIGGAVVLLFGLVFVSDSPTQPLGASGRPSASGTPSGVPPPVGSAPGGTGPGPNGPPKPSDYPPTDKARDCAAVASAMQTDRYIQSLYADPGLLAKAAAQHWSGSQYDGQIKLEVSPARPRPAGSRWARSTACRRAARRAASPARARSAPARAYPWTSGPRAAIPRSSTSRCRSTRRSTPTCATRAPSTTATFR